MTAEPTGTAESRPKSKVRMIVRACNLISRMMRAQPGAMPSEVMYYEMIGSYFSRLLDAEKNGDFIAAHTVFFPAELIYSLGLVPMHTEMTTWTASLFTGETSDIIEAGAALGLATEICTPHRGLVGAFATKVVPRPSVMLWSNMICDNTAKSGELLMELAGCPGHFVDHPFKDSPVEKQYLREEMADVVSFLEEQSGRKMDWQVLAETMDRTDRQIQLSREISELRKATPSPLRPRGFLELMMVDYLFPGQPETIKYLETLKQDLSAMVAAGKGAVSNERFRLMTLFIPPMYLLPLFDAIFEEFGAASVVEPFFTSWGDGRLDANDPLTAMVEKQYILPEARMYGPLEDRALKAVTDCATEYRIDGAIYYADVACRQSCAMIKIFKDRLGEVDVPTLTLDCDVVDPTITSREEVREKMERFFELLEDR